MLFLAFSVPIGSFPCPSGSSFQILITWLSCFGHDVEALQPNLAVIKLLKRSTAWNCQSESSANIVLGRAWRWPWG
jgi:hypothetical protein